MSAFPPLATELRTLLEVRFVPSRDIIHRAEAKEKPPHGGISRALLVGRSKRLVFHYQADFSKTSVNQSGSLIMTGWPDVVFSKTVQDLSALHSANALSNAASGNLGKRM